MPAPPDHPTAASISRREFFASIVDQIAEIVDDNRHIYQLSALRDLPDPRLAQIIPVINPAKQIRVQDGYLWSHDQQTGEERRHFVLSPENTVVFNLLDGRHTLGSVGQQTAVALGWEEARGFAHARALFLDLVDSLVCVPSNPLGKG